MTDMLVDQGPEKKRNGAGRSMMDMPVDQGPEEEEEERKNGKDGASPVPDRARIVLVPIANPETAPSLLAIAASLADTEEGKVVALAVVTDDTTAEKRSGALEELEEVVSGTGWVPGVTFERNTRVA